MPPLLRGLKEISAFLKLHPRTLRRLRQKYPDCPIVCVEGMLYADGERLVAWLYQVGRAGTGREE